TLRPRSAASRAMPAPLMPPPMIRRSKRSCSRASSAASRQAGPVTEGNLTRPIAVCHGASYGGLPRQPIRHPPSSLRMTSRGSSSRDAEDLVQLGKDADVAMVPARQGVQALQCGGARLERGSRRAGEGGEEEWHVGRKGGGDPCAQLALLGRGRVVDGHLHVDVASRRDREAQALLVLVPAGALSGVA